VGAGYLEVAQPALKGHLGHGDYVTTLVVSHDAAQTGDGVHFVRIGDALGAARAGRLDRGELAEAACRITIAVAAGVYNGTVTGQPFDDIDRFPLIVDVPDITLRGALVMGLDEAGRATGDATEGSRTTLRPVETASHIAGSQTPIIIANAHPGGSAGNGLSVEGFVFESGHAPPASHGGIRCAEHASRRADHPRKSIQRVPRRCRPPSRQRRRSAESVRDERRL
jgi:hypothetical protein